MGNYRFNCALQHNNDTDASDNGNYDSPATSKQAIAVVERVRQLGKSVLPKKAHEDFDEAIDGVIDWLNSKAGVGYRPSGNYDITEARQTFKHNGVLYRVDIKAGGKTSEGAWFL